MSMSYLKIGFKMVDLDGTKWNQVFDVLEDWEQILKGCSFE